MNGDEKLADAATKISYLEEERELLSGVVSGDLGDGVGTGIENLRSDELSENDQAAQDAAIEAMWARGAEEAAAKNAGNTSIDKIVGQLPR